MYFTVIFKTVGAPNQSSQKDWKWWSWATKRMSSGAIQCTACQAVGGHTGADESTVQDITGNQLVMIKGLPKG